MIKLICMLKHFSGCSSYCEYFILFHVLVISVLSYTCSLPTLPSF